MVWYPTVDIIVNANKVAVRKDKHPHKLIRSVESIQSLIDSIKESESMDLTYQAARFMKELVYLHAFDGGNHRTAYSITILFLTQNEMQVRTVSPSIAYAFAKMIGTKSIGEVQAWILGNMIVL